MSESADKSPATSVAGGEPPLVAATHRQLHVGRLTPRRASCSSPGRLTFDADLPKQAAAFRAKAIVHELLHFKVPNHGKVFKALLKTYLAVIHGLDSKLR